MGHSVTRTSCNHRCRQSGASVFFTVALTDVYRHTAGRADRPLRDSVRLTMGERPCWIDARVVLRQHLHAIWTLLEGDADYSTRWRLIKTRFSRGLPVGQQRQSHVARQERGIWPRRFWERHLRDDRDFAAHLQYCWFNPVKHGFVERPEDRECSSVHREIRLGRYGWWSARLHSP